MDLITREHLQELAEKKAQWCASVYLPTHRTSRETQQDRTMLKNLLDQAEEHLIANGMRGPEARQMIAPARQLLDETVFWIHQSDGLAVFLAPGFFRHYRLPQQFQELLVISDCFHLKPLVPLLNGDGTFYMLGLNQKDVRVLQGSRWSVRELELAQVPATLAEALKFDDLEKQLQIHTHHQQQPERGTGKGEGMFHGHGPGGEIQKNQLLRFFQKIDRGLHELLRTKRAPLVLAGVDYYFPIYREANTYNHLVEGGIEGSPNGFNLQDLHQRAWQMVEPIFRKKQQDALALYQQALGTGRASNDLGDILKAVRQGRVGTLFVALNRHQWGKFDPHMNAFEKHDAQKPGDLDLLDHAAVQTLLNSGTVYAVPPNQMPDGSSAAAIYRY